MSAIQSNNQINVNEINQVNQSINSDYYLNLMIGAQLANQINKFEAKGGLNYKNISLFILLLSIGELKNLIKYIGKEGITFISTNYKPFFSGLWTYSVNCPSFVYENIKNLFRRKKYNSNNKIEFANEPLKQEYLMTVVNEFVKGLINYLQDSRNSSDVNYTINNNKKIIFNNMETIEINEIWNDILIYYKNIKILLNTELDLTFEKIDGIEKRNLKKFNSNIISFDETSNTELLNSYFQKTEITEIKELINDPFIFSLLNTIDSKGYIKNIQHIDLINFKDFKQACLQLDSLRTDFSQGLSYNNIAIYILIILGTRFPMLLHKNKIGLNIKSLNFIFDIVNKALSNSFPLSKIFFGNDFDELYFFDITIKITESYREVLKDLKHINIFRVGEKYNLEDYIFEVVHNLSSVKVIVNNNSTNIKASDYIRSKGSHFWYSLSKMFSCSRIIAPPFKNEICKISNGATLTTYFMSYTNTFAPNFEKGMMEIGLLGENDKISDKNNEKSSNEKSTNQINFICKGINSSITEEEINQNFNDFINTIKTNGYVTNSDKLTINICKIKLEKTPIKKEIPNPAYQLYLEKKEMLEKLLNQNNIVQSNKTEIETKQSQFQQTNFGSNSETIIKEFTTIPPKTLIETTIKKEIKTEIVNTGFKTFDTMYLKELDEKKLLSVLTKFKSNKELLKSLGLPNKLCVMLDGLPGTGKSSAILTIASYLKKDIYYLSFGDTIETNDDLQMIFDHVVKNCNGGIIVAEDIDAVGSLLHSRTNSIIENTTKTMETTTHKLSLAYVLNLLQGTITPDNLIFIATTNHIEKLDPAFYRHGRFDVRITFQLADHYQLNKIYSKFFQRQIPKNLLSRIQEYKYTPAQFIFTVKDYISEDYSDEIILENFLE